jgi:hypothetical protein
MKISLAIMQNCAEFPPKLKIKLDYNPGIPPLGIYPKEIKSVF